MSEPVTNPTFPGSGASMAEALIDSIRRTGQLSLSQIEAVAVDCVGRGALGEAVALGKALAGFGMDVTVRLAIAGALLRGAGIDALAGMLMALLSGSPATRLPTAMSLRKAALDQGDKALRDAVLNVLLNALYHDGEIPDQTGRYREIAQLLLNLDRHKDAKPIFTEILRVFPLDREAAEALARIDCLDGDAGSAAALTEYCRALDYQGGRSAREPRPPTLLLAARRLNVRAAKIARFLRPLGWRVEGLCMHCGPSEEAEFDAVHRYASDLEAARTAKALGADVTHFLCTMTDYAACALAISHGVTPLIADIYDVVNEMLTDDWFRCHPDVAALRPLERYVMEKADGLCMRNLQPQPLKRRGLLRLSRPTIFFPEYTWGDVTPQQKLSARDGIMRVVYAGGVGDEYLFFCRRAAEFGFEFHLYPYHDDAWGVSFEQKQAVYVAEAETNPMFRLHKPVFGPDFLKEISCYDVQLNIDFVVMQTDADHRPEKIRYGYANKFADCIDANLLFVSNAGCFCNQLGRRWGITADADLERLSGRDFWDGLRRQTTTADFARARDEWRMDRQIPRLEGFYQRLIGGASSRTAEWVGTGGAA